MAILMVNIRWCVIFSATDRGHRDTMKIGPVLVLRERGSYGVVKYLKMLIIHLKI